MYDRFSVNSCIRETNRKHFSYSVGTMMEKSLPVTQVLQTASPCLFFPLALPTRCTSSLVAALSNPCLSLFVPKHRRSIKYEESASIVKETWQIRGSYKVRQSMFKLSCGEYRLGSRDLWKRGWGYWSEQVGESWESWSRRWVESSLEWIGLMIVELIKGETKSLTFWKHEYRELEPVWGFFFWKEVGGGWHSLGNGGLSRSIGQRQ